MTLTFGSSSLKERFDKRKDVDLEDILEMHYWEFDLERKNIGERLAFKNKLRYFASWYKEQLKKLEIESAQLIDEKMKLQGDLQQLRDATEGVVPFVITKIVACHGPNGREAAKYTIYYNVNERQVL